MSAIGDQQQRSSIAGAQQLSSGETEWGGRWGEEGLKRQKGWTKACGGGRGKGGWKRKRLSWLPFTAPVPVPRRRAVAERHQDGSLGCNLAAFSRYLDGTSLCCGRHFGRHDCGIQSREMRWGVSHPVAAIARCYGAIDFSENHPACDGDTARQSVELTPVPVASIGGNHNAQHTLCSCMIKHYATSEWCRQFS
jgi:hypothetical protein